MKLILFFFGVFCFSLLTYSQYCITGGPNSTLDSNVESVTIFGDGGSSINHIGCPGVTGVENLTTQEVTLGSGNSYSIDVQFGTCGNNYSGNGEVWIDYNGNQVFEASESIGQWSGMPPVASSTFNFTVPGTVFNGIVRMRVMHREGGAAPPLNPCEAYSWGSVMDFSVNLGPGIDCTGYEGDNEADAIVVNSFPYLHSYATNVCYSSQSAAYVSPDVFYLLEIPAGTYGLKASLCGSSFDTYMTVYDTDGNLLAINDDFEACGQNAQVSFNTQNEDSVYLVVEGWGTESGAYELLIANEIASISENPLDQVKLFPNPTTSEFQLSGIENAQIQILSLNGAVVFETTSSPSNSFSVEGYSPGIYLVNIKKDAFTRIIKLHIL